MGPSCPIEAGPWEIWERELHTSRKTFIVLMVLITMWWVKSPWRFGSRGNWWQKVKKRKEKQTRWVERKDYEFSGDSYFQEPLVSSFLEVWEFPWIALQFLESLCPCDTFFLLFFESYLQLVSNTRSHRANTHITCWSSQLQRVEQYAGRWTAVHSPVRRRSQNPSAALLCLIQQALFPYRILHIC